jgi:hypothetical protein
MVLKLLGGQMQHVKSLKLFRPLSAYTTHPRWQQLAGPDCSFAEACSLLDSGLAADFLDASMAADAQGAHAQSTGSSSGAGSGRSTPEARAQHRRLREQGLRRVARWLEYPPGSKQYVTLISQRAVNNRQILLAGAVCPPGWQFDVLALGGSCKSTRSCLL